LIDVKAAGMNFRDVLKALALYPGDAPDARIFGDEVGGIVR
jgi:NADPH:quinone reductase-like Zn-dependent oxidoreductase